MKLFDRRLLRRRRKRAAPGFRDHAFLIDEATARITERLSDINRPFGTALILGPDSPALHRWLRDNKKTETVIFCDLAEEMLPGDGLGVAADAEWLPFRAEHFDLVIDLLSLHWINDLPGCLIQINRALVPDGLFLGAMPGGETLGALREWLAAAEIECEGGLSPRVSPFVSLSDAAGLLQRAEFAMPVADIERLEVSYADPLALMRDLRGMGETNALMERRRTPLKRRTLFRAAELYAETHGDESGRIRARFDLLFLTGWAPHPDQPKPKRPGSAETRLADALGTKERSTGIKAGG